LRDLLSALHALGEEELIALFSDQLAAITRRA
jgi:hypothetical protein